MLVTSATIESYGHFKDRSFDFGSEKIVIIYGPNEAGKSTFASFLLSMFFGFSPASEATHPYSPIGEQGLKGRMDFISDDRRRCSIQRELQSVPKSRYLSGEGLFGDELDLRNRTIPQADHISRRVFESVYSLTLSDMEHIESKTWDFIQDRLLGGLNMEFLRPTRIVIETLEQEGKSYWRPDRRGKPLASELEDKLRHLQRNLRTARENDRKVRELAATINKLKDRRAELRRTRTALKQKHHLFSKVQPVRTLISRIDQLKEEAGDADSFVEIPDNPVVFLKDLTTRKRQLLDRHVQIDGDLQEISAAVEEFKPEYARLRAEEDEVRAWSTRVGRHEATTSELEECEERIASELERIRPIFASTFVGSDVRETLTDLRGVDTASLKTLFDRLAEVDRNLERRTTDDVASAGPLLSNLWILTIAVGVVITVLGLVSNGFLAIASGLLFVGLGIFLRGVLSLQPGVNKASMDHSPQVRSEILRAIRSQISPVKISEHRLQKSVSDLFIDIMRMHDVAVSLESMEARKSRLIDTIHDDHRKLRLLTNSVGTDNHAVPTVLIARLMRDLETANYRYHRSESAKKRRAPLLREKSALEKMIAELENDEAQIASRLKEVGGGDVKAGAIKLSTMRKAMDRVTHLSETLDKNYPDWRDIVERATESMPEPEEDNGLVDSGVEVQLDEVEEELQQLSSKIAAMQEQAKALSKEASVSDVENQIDSCRHDLASAKIQRDRRELMAAILKKSETLFREEHQPDVIRKANEYLKLITVGRYDRLIVDDVTGELRLWNNDVKGLVDVSTPLSRGTLDQIYLALRMAIIDHLDANHERIPLFLDEVLVNWDQRRRERAYAILKSMSNERQIFFFTCHRWMVEETEELLNAKVVRLN